MKQTEAETFIGKKIRLILTNNFHFSGMVLDCNDDTLTLKDKFNKNVSIKLSEIMIFSEI